MVPLLREFDYFCFDIFFGIKSETETKRHNSQNVIGREPFSFLIYFHASISI